MTLTIQPLPLFEDNPQPTSSSTDIGICSICLDSIAEDNNGIYTVPECSHKFHNTCIIEWLRTGSGSCPVCRGTQSARTRGYYYFCDKKNIVRLVLAHSKRKDAPKPLVRLVKKYERTREDEKQMKKELTIFRKEHKELFKKKTKLQSKHWSLIRRLRSLRNELSSIPIQPVRRDVKKK